MRSDIEIIEVDQGSKEWHAARAGVITGSMMQEVLTVTGGLTPQQQAFVDARQIGRASCRERVFRAV